MRTIVKWSMLSVMLLGLNSCLGEAKEKLDKAKEGITNTSTLVKEARNVEGRIKKLKDAVPLSSDELKGWLPEKLSDMQRTAFKVGPMGMYKVNSVEATYEDTTNEKKFKVSVIDGAGPIGSTMAAGFGMLGNYDMEEEDALKHRQTVEVKGIKAQQTYMKKSNDTQLMFSYDERFLVTINAAKMQPDETWALVHKLDLSDLTDMAE
ncbi:hypothetical protein [Zobellia uliginosa]|uniref:hypothetical protein n=1 Tax=Zobellia uliginosa TaxID=143224 RepID=UPI0026E25E30|nr:hypothetical protein [Zobellia uliginosa]MDO6516313.1 hypothetical protein [Zobellia uliginosa]